jgi:hypothetical protein
MTRKSNYNQNSKRLISLLCSADMNFSFNFLGESDEGLKNDQLIKSNDSNCVDFVASSSNFTREVATTECKLENIPYVEFETGVGVYKRSILHYQTGIDKDLDLISGTYEGGYKVWECSIDLMTYMVENKCSLPPVATSSVIELGCGHGFPGIVALQMGYKKVLFSDLNAEVLVDSTWPNIYVNCSPKETQYSTCFSGDWLSLSDHLSHITKAKESSRFVLWIYQLLNSTG